MTGIWCCGSGEVVASEQYRLGTGPRIAWISWSVEKLLSALACWWPRRAVGWTSGSPAMPPRWRAAPMTRRLVDCLRMLRVTLRRGLSWTRSDINRMGRVLALGGSMDGSRRAERRLFGTRARPWR